MAKRKYKEAVNYSPGHWVRVPTEMQESPNWLNMSDRGKALFFTMFCQFKGQNNGDLCAAYALLKGKGWPSKSKLMAARQELEHYGFIEVTRQGGKNKVPTLYALTFINVHKCWGKLNVPATDYPSDKWRIPVEKWVNPYRDKRSASRLKKLNRQVPTPNLTGLNPEPVIRDFDWKKARTGSNPRPIPMIFRINRFQPQSPL